MFVMFRDWSYRSRTSTEPSCSGALFRYQMRVESVISLSTSHKNSTLSSSKTSLHWDSSLRTGLGRSGSYTSSRDLRDLEISDVLTVSSFVMDAQLTRDLQRHWVTLLCGEGFYTPVGYAVILPTAGII